MRQLLLRYYNIYEFMDENDSNFDMNSEPLSSRSNKYRKKYLRRTEKMGRWKSTEQEKYLEFLHENKSLFQKSLNKRTTRVYKKLAEAIPGRNPEQCRSHHLKLSRTCKWNFDQIIKYVEKKIKVGSDQQAEVKQIPPNQATDYRRVDFLVYNKEVMKKGQGRGIKCEIYLHVEINIDALEEW